MTRSACTVFHRLFNQTLVFLLVLLSASCSKITYDVVYPTLSDGRYDSEFPYRNCSSELGKIAKTIKKVHCLVEYKTYLFDHTQGLTKKQLKTSRLDRIAVATSTFNESVGASAILIFSDEHRCVLLTSAHTFDYADTLFTFYTENENKEDAILQSISIKTKQQNFARELGEFGLLDLLVMDMESDIAFLYGHSDDPQAVFPIFDYPLGNSKQIEWGTFIYAIGFPAGNKMITRGIVANPEPDRSGAFLIDALFNQGMSGGVVLAIRDGVPNFEMVGIVKSVSARFENVLRPEKDSHEKVYNQNLPYEGNMYVKLQRNINYGITYAVSVETVFKLYLMNHKKFSELNINLDTFFMKEKK